MKYIQAILLVFLNLTLIGQKTYLIDFNSSCKDINFEDIEDIYQLKTQIIAYDLKYELLTIELVTTLNCSYGDTGYFKFSNDTLFLNTSNKKHIEIGENGDSLVVERVAECDCFFNFSFDIYGFLKMPRVIQYNGQDIELNNFKYKKGETQKINENLEIISDNCGYTYKTIYYDSGGIKIIARGKGIKSQEVHFNMNGKVVKIRTNKNFPTDWKIVNIKN